jgi:hypothetical protein
MHEMKTRLTSFRFTRYFESSLDCTDGYPEGQLCGPFRPCSVMPLGTMLRNG